MIPQMNPSGGLVSLIPDVILVVVTIGVVAIAIHARGAAKIDIVEDFLKVTYYPLRTFFRDSRRLFKRCTKPNKQEFTRMCTATAIGFALMGIIGFAVKLIHIPINNILVS